jgi:O-antigen biosynthesis protein WbqP
MIRLFDFLFALFGLLALLPILIVLIVIGYFDTGSPFFVQERMGLNKKAFKLVKFRSMHLNTKSVATHLAHSSSVTNYGMFLRSSKLDELPQLWNVLLGEMSLVGPRPNLVNQDELIQERHSLGVYSLKPGITGLAQINKIDMSTPKELARIDAQMMDDFGVNNYFHYILVTVLGKGSGDRIVHK